MTFDDLYTIWSNALTIIGYCWTFIATNMLGLIAGLYLLHIIITAVNRLRGNDR